MIAEHIQQLKPPQQRYLALAILLLILLCGYSLLLQPLITRYHALAEEVDSLEFQFNKYQQLSQHEQAYIDNLNDYQKSVADSQYFLLGNKASLASAHLQEYLRKVINRAGAQLSSTQDLNFDEEENNNTRVGLQVSSQVNIKQLTDILLQLETGKPLLFLENIEIIANSRRRENGKASSKKNQERKNKNTLSLRFDLLGYLAPLEEQQ